MRISFSAAAIAALLCGGCSAPTELSARKDTGLVDGPLPVTRLRAEPYSFAYNSGLAESARLVVRDPAAWQQVWSMLGNSASPAAPPVDFAAEMVVVAALGTRPTGGYSIFVDSAYRRADHIEVVVRKVAPGSSCGTTQALTQPADVARIPASSLPVRFRERDTVHDCG
jgi:hypothetical protein